MRDIDSDELLKRIYSLIENVDKRKDKAKAEAYTVKLTDNYAMHLREEFFKLDGERSGLEKAWKSIEILRNEEE